MSIRSKPSETPPSEEPSLVRRARAHADRIAVVASEGLFTYRDLLEASTRVARRLLAAVPGTRAADGTGIRPGAGDLGEARIAFLVPPGFHHVAVQWGIWRAGGVAVPLAVSHPLPELAHVLNDVEPVAVVVHPSLTDRITPLAEERGLPVLDAGKLCEALDAAELPASAPGVPPDQPPLPGVSGNRRALVIHTSGTTGHPKGVVMTHAHVEAQVTSLVTAWEWSSEDHILLVLPLHHVHGIINVVTCALWAGACCQMLPRFDAPETWERFARGDVTLFMAVPTVYIRLIRAWEEASEGDRGRWSEGARKMRLMVSGSAALPINVLERWREITGQVLLERYGMTEIGMGLSSPLRGERRPGYVGQPLPGVEVRRVDDAGHVLSDSEAPGELEVRGPGVFSEYWQRPEETVGAFRDGWFRTGDVATEENGYYRLLGRMSVDIIKTGGYKVSALDVEETLREHEDVEDCAVVGVPDPELGERICVALVAPGEATVVAPGEATVVAPGEATVVAPGEATVVAPGEATVDPGIATIDADAVLAWAKQRLAPYKVPREIRIVAELPRNAMGKVQKQDVKTLFETENPA